LLMRKHETMDIAYLEIAEKIIEQHRINNQYLRDKGIDPVTGDKYKKQKPDELEWELEIIGIKTRSRILR